MNWSLEDLESRFKRINASLKRETDPKIKEILEFDLITIKIMIGYIKNMDIPEYPGSEERSRLKSTCSYLTANPSKTAQLIYRQSPERLPSAFILNNHISNEEYYELVDKFFKEFDSEHCKIYRELVDNSKIELNPRKFGESNPLGNTHHIISDNVTYIFSRFDGSFNIALTLPHEVGHARQFDGVNDMDTEINIIYSLLREAYPMFMGFAFTDYLKNTKYYKQAFGQEWEKLDEVIKFKENYLVYLANVGSSEYYDYYFYYKNGCGCSDAIFRFFYSSLFAIYFNNMYRKDRSKAMKVMNKFNDSVGRVPDEEIIENYDLEAVGSSLIEAAGNYLRTYKRR